MAISADHQERYDIFKGGLEEMLHTVKQVEKYHRDRGMAKSKS